MAEACHAFEKIAGTHTAHIRFSYNGKKDRISLVCEKGMLKQIVAKDETCKDGESIPWKDSEFSGSTPEQAFLKYFDDINKIQVSHPKMKKTWDSLADFEAWLKTAAKGKIEQ